jgi:hypothetical protein
MNSRIRKLLVVLAVIVVGLIIAATTLQPRGEKISQRINLPPTFKTAVRYGDTSVVLSNDRAFVSYDYITGVSQLLSADNQTSGLANIDSLSASDNGKYLLFHTEQVADQSTLQSILNKQSLSTADDYWWLFSTTDQSFRPLAARTLQAKLTGDYVDTLTNGGSSETITRYNLSDLKQAKQTTIPGSIDFWSYNDGYLLQLADQSIAFTTDGVITQTFYNKTSLLSLIAGSTTAIGATGQGDSKQLVELKLDKRTSTVIAGALAEAPVTTPSGNILYITSDGSGPNANNTFTSYDAVSHKKTAWDLKDTAASLKNSEAAPLLALLQPMVAIGTTATGDAFLVGNQLQPIKSPTGYSATITAQGNPLHVTYDDTVNSFVVSYSALPQNLVVTALAQQLRHDGFNPDLYQIVFSEGD